MTIENLTSMLKFVENNLDKDHVVFCQHVITRLAVAKELRKLGYEVRDMACPPRESIFHGHVVRSVSWFNHIIPSAPRKALISSRFLALSNWQITRNCCVSNTYEAEYQDEYPHLILHFGSSLQCKRLELKTEQVMSVMRLAADENNM